MAFTNFYVQSGGSDLNAGSTTSNSASLTYAGGTFVRATGVFTVASGNPLSDGVLIGDYVSIYTTSGATSATFIAQVTARDSTTVTVSATLRWGVNTTVSETAAATTLKVGGAHASELPWATMTGTIAASTKVNIKAATYTLTASRTFALNGATTTPLWFSGYNTTPGDIDADISNSLTKPVLALNATFSIAPSGASQIWSGLSVTGNRANTLWSGVLSNLVSRCRFENTSTNAGAVAFTQVGASIVMYSWFKCPTTATTSGTFLGGTGPVIGCVSEGGGLAGFNAATNASQFAQCVALNNTGVGFGASTGAMRVMNCTVYNSTVDGVRWSGTPAAGSCVVSTLLAVCGGYGITNASGTDTSNVVRACNDFYSCSSGSENGFGDQPAFFGKTDVSNPVTGSTDMTPASGANARANGFPGIFENQSYSSYQDIGAVRHVDPGGSAGVNRAALPSGLSSLG